MIEGLEQELNRLEEVSKLCERIKVSCLISLNVWGGERVETSYYFANVDRVKAKVIMRSLGISKMDKLYRFGDIDLQFSNVTISSIAKCKVVGYNEKVVPEHVEKVPIYDCGNNEKTVEAGEA